MRTKLLMTVFFIGIFTYCNERHASLNQEAIDKIVKEIDSSLNIVIDGWNTLDVNTGFKSFHNGDEFTFIGIDGTITDYEGLISMSRNMFQSWKSAEFKLLKKDIKPLFNEMVLVSAIYSSTIEYPDGSIENYPKVGSTFIFRKINEKWMVTHFQESSLLPEINESE